MLATDKADPKIAPSCLLQSGTEALSRSRPHKQPLRQPPKSAIESTGRPSELSVTDKKIKQTQNITHNKNDIETDRNIYKYYT